MKMEATSFAETEATLACPSDLDAAAGAILNAFTARLKKKTRNRFAGKKSMLHPLRSGADIHSAQEEHLLRSVKISGVNDWDALCS